MIKCSPSLPFLSPRIIRLSQLSIRASIVGRQQGDGNHQRARAGMAHITATANDGSQSVVSSPATLTVNSPPPTITRIEVAPSSATIGTGDMQQFTAKGF
jgi:hypothetical protein